MRLLIPTAKLVNEELQNIGKLPAIIYPVNKGIVFDYLQRQYGNNIDAIDVICYQKADKVEQRLRSYRNPKINIIVLDQLRDLASTVFNGIIDEDEIVINFGDTIVADNITELSEDCFFYSEGYFSDTWTFFEISDGILGNIIDKKNSEVFTKDRGKLFVGVFRISHTHDFKKCLEDAINNDNNEISSFYSALREYSRIHHLEAYRTDNWFDLGHADTYFSSQLEVQAREFNHISIDRQRGILKKTSQDVDKFIGEIKWYLKLPSDIEYVRPRIFDYSISYSSPFVAMEYYAYHTIHELYLYGDLSYSQWVDIFKLIRFVLNDFGRYSVEDEKIRSSLEDMYLKKTLQRFESIRKDKRFSNFFCNNISVNGVKYKSLSEVENIIQKQIPKILYNVKKFSIIHGDLCFANMMVDGNFSFLKIVDPRGKFGSFDIYGDQRYEIAKLFHSVDGKYDFIIKDLFLVDYDTNKAIINFEIFDRLRNFDLFELLKEVLRNEIVNKEKEIELIEALLFLSMIPLHKESFNHQMVMLGTGLEILNRVIPITCESNEGEVYV